VREVAGGLVILLAATWIGCQVFGGEALERLGVVKREED
jgi:hypothetical protein